MMLVNLYEFIFIMSILKLSLGQDTTVKSATYESDQVTISSTEYTTEHSTFDPCEEIKPYCVCDGMEINCRNFDSFEQIDFSPFGYPDNRTVTIDILTFTPKVPLTLNDSLTISNIVIKQWLILQNINGIELLSNPFRNAILRDRVTIIFEDSSIRTFETSCDTRIIPEGYVSLFSLFNSITFNGCSYDGAICPLIFSNSNIIGFRSKSMNSTNYLKFSQLSSPTDEANLDINSNILFVYIELCTDLIVDDKIFNKHVFARSYRIEFFICDLMIDEQAFYHTQNLTSIYFATTSFKKFIQSSNNTWMSGLNRNVRVNYSDASSIANNRKYAMVLDIFTFDEYYTYPDEDFIYFKHFPHENFVFARIQANRELECSNTLRWLLKNAQYHPLGIGYFNTTAVRKCFISTPLTTYTSIPEIESTVKLPIESTVEFNTQFITSSAIQSTSQGHTELTTKLTIQHTSESKTEQTNQYSEHYTFESTSKPSTKSTTRSTNQDSTESGIDSTSEYSHEYNTESTSKPITESTVQATSSSTWKMLTNTTRSMDKESKKVLLNVYLYTVIPIAIVCLLTIIACVIVLFLYIRQRSKIHVNDLNNNDDIELKPVNSSSQAN